MVTTLACPVSPTYGLPPAMLPVNQPTKGLSGAVVWGEAKDKKTAFGFLEKVCLAQADVWPG